MVGTIKKWLGIDILERENLILVKALKAAHRRITDFQGVIKATNEHFEAECGEIVTALSQDRAFSQDTRHMAESENKEIREALNGSMRMLREEFAAEIEKQLTSEPPKPKIEPKPHRANWRTFRAMAEKASDEEKEA